MRQMLDLVGNTYHKLKVVSFSHFDTGHNSHWNCICDCGGTKTTRGGNLKRGTTKSCGCLNGTHHMSFSLSYLSWANMLQRCNNPNNKWYHRYGGRGIKVCKIWEKFENFYADMGERINNLTLDRIDNDRNYEPGNCKWSTAKEQANNRNQNNQYTVVA